MSNSPVDSWGLRPPEEKGLAKLGGQLPGQVQEAPPRPVHLESATPPGDSLKDPSAGEFPPSRGYHYQPVP